MFPTNSTKTFIAASLQPGSVPEPDLSSRDFLNSFLEHGCWLRLLAAKQQLEVIENVASSEIEKLAALTTFYQLAGQLAEDTLTSYIAWSIWAKDKARPLADIYERLSLKFAPQKKPVEVEYLEQIYLKFASTKKRVDVFPRDYLSQLVTRPEHQLPAVLGISWKRDPSVRLVPKEYRHIWDGLGRYIQTVIEPLCDNRGALLASCYNKIKHGPQLVVSSPKLAAAARGFSDTEAAKVSGNLSVRLLLDGARLQERQEEVENTQRVSPFLVVDTGNLRRWFFQQMLFNVQWLFLLGSWIFNTTYQGTNRPLKIGHPQLQKIIREQGKHLHAIFP